MLIRSDFKENMYTAKGQNEVRDGWMDRWMDGRDMTKPRASPEVSRGPKEFVVSKK